MEIAKEYPQRELTERIIGAAINVHKILGAGFTETVYEGAFDRELSISGLKFDQQKEVKIIYKEKVVAKYRLDYIIENKVIVELKAVDKLSDLHTAQLLAYLRATGLEVGLLLNFNVKTKEGIKRIVLTQKQKESTERAKDAL